MQKFLKRWFLGFIMTSLVNGVERIYLCQSGKHLIDSHKICNVERDCTDGSDERFCFGQDNSYLGRWHRTIRSIETTSGRKHIYDQRRILDPSDCLCRVDNSQNSKDCLVKEDMAHIINNGAKDCYAGQDEILDFVDLAKALKTDELYQIFQFAESYGVVCGDKGCILREYPTHITQGKCPEKFYTYCHTSLLCIRNSYPCKTEDRELCPINRVLNEYSQCVVVSDPTDEYEKITFRDSCPRHQWSCPKTNSLKDRENACSNKKCVVPFSCSEEGSANHYIISVQAQERHESSFFIQLGLNASVAVSRTKSNYLNYDLSIQGELQLKKQQHDRTTLSSNSKKRIINVNILCLDKSWISLSVDEDQKVPFVSMIMKSDNFANFIKLEDHHDKGDDQASKKNKESVGGVVRLKMTPMNFSKITFIYDSSYDLSLDFESNNEGSPPYNVELEKKNGISVSNMCPRGFINITMRVKGETRMNRVLIGQRTEALIIMKNQMHYLDRTNRIQYYEFSPHPERINFIIVLLNKTLSQCYVVIEDIILELTLLETADVLERIQIKEKPESFKVTFKLREDSIILFLGLVAFGILIFCGFIALLIFNYKRRKLTEESRRESLRSQERNIVNKNEYYGEYSSVDVQLEVRYPNYYYDRESASETESKYSDEKDYCYS